MSDVRFHYFRDGLKERAKFDGYRCYRVGYNSDGGCWICLGWVRKRAGRGPWGYAPGRTKAEAEDGGGFRGCLRTRTEAAECLYRARLAPFRR